MQRNATHALGIMIVGALAALMGAQTVQASSLGWKSNATNFNSQHGIVHSGNERGTGHSFTFDVINSGNWTIAHFAVRVVDASMGGYDNNTLAWPAMSANAASSADAFTNIQTASTADRYAMFSASSDDLQVGSAPSSITVSFGSSHADGGGTAFDIVLFDISGTLVQSTRVNVPYGSSLASGHMEIFSADSLADAYWQPSLTEVQALVIPLPAPVWMGLAGLLGIAVLRRRSLSAA